MSNKSTKHLKLRQLSDSLTKKTLLPIDGLGRRLRDIREALGMTQTQMAKRLKVKQPVISRLEDNIKASSLSTIIKIAGALELEFMGAFIARVPLEAIIRKQAERAAKRALARTFANMAMEKQAPGQAAYKYQLDKLIKEFIADPSPAIWEE